MQETLRTVKYSVQDDEKFVKISLKLGRTKRLVFSQMLDYFYRSKKDPLDLNDELLKREISNGINRVLSFVKRQESDFLLPILNDSAGSILISKEHTSYLKDILGYLEDNEGNAKDMIGRMMLLEKAIARTQQYLDEKGVLKLRFKKLLEYYITQRESLGWPVSVAKKEELQSHVRQSLENL